MAQVPPGFTLLALVGALAAPFGCALTDETINPPRRSEVATGSRRGGNREIVVVAPFGDSRPDSSRCGMKKNGYNVETAKVLCGTAPQYFLPDLLTQELVASGFRVFRKGPRPGAAMVHGQVVQYFVEPKYNVFSGAIEADIGLTLVVDTPDGFTARRRFYVKGEEGSLWASLEDKQTASDRAVRELLLDTVGAISNLLDAHAASVPPPPENLPETSGEVE
jgi:hypothetical protein